MWLLLPLFSWAPSWTALPQQFHEILAALLLAALLLLRSRHLTDVSIHTFKGVVGIVLLLSILMVLHVEHFREFSWLARNQGLVLGAVAILSLSKPLVWESWMGLARLVWLALFVLAWQRWGIGNGAFNQENHLALFLLASSWLGVLALVKTQAWNLQRWGGVLLVVSSSLWLWSTGAKALQIGWIVFWVLGFAARRGGKMPFVLWLSIVLIVLGLPLISLNTDLSPLGSSYLARQDIWQAALAMSLEHFPFGVGFHSFGAYSADYYPTLDSARYTITTLPPSAHNLLVHWFAELGVLGVVLLVALLSRTLWIAKSWDRAFLVAQLPALALTHAAVGFISSLMLLLWFLCYVEMKFQRDLLLGIGRRMSLLWLYRIWAVFLLFSAYQVGQILHAESLVANILVQNKVHGMQDVARLQASLEIRENSIATFYASSVFLQNGALVESEHWLNRTEVLSGSRWPVTRRRFELFVAKGQCEHALQYAPSIIARERASEIPWIVPKAPSCLESRSPKGATQ